MAVAPLFVFGGLMVLGITNSPPIAIFSALSLFANAALIVFLVKKFGVK
jgi:hypothetical protein